MSIIGRLERNIFNLSVTDERAWNPSLWNLYGSQSLTGENVTESTALTYSAVWCAVNLIAGTVSTLPLHLLRKDKRKTIKAEEKPLYRVLYREPNPHMTADIYRQTITAHILLWGNCYSEIVRDMLGNVVELWPIAPNRVKPMMENGELVYKIQVGAEEITLPRRQILHIPGLGFDGIMGYSVVAMARKSLALGMAMETFGSNYFGNGTHPGIVLSHPQKLSPEGHSNLQSALRSAWSGLGQSHRLMLLQEGLNVEKIGVSPEDSQFLESRQFQIPEVARWFNLPPHKLKDLTKSSFSNIESEQISFVTDSILPILIHFEQNYELQLLTKDEKIRQKLYFWHNVDGLLRGSAKDRAEYFRIMSSIGAMSINDIREKENMDPVENEFADEYFVPLNMVPLSMLREQLEKKDQKTPVTGDQDTKMLPSGGSQ